MTRSLESEYSKVVAEICSTSAVTAAWCPVSDTLAARGTNGLHTRTVQSGPPVARMWASSSNVKH